VVLPEGHPLYGPPAPGEQHCYRPAQLVFPDVRQVNWIERNIRPVSDATDRVDHGNIDTMYEKDGVCHLEGDWGIVEVASGRPELIIDSGRAAEGYGERRQPPEECRSR
jgi:hypothetical protein